MALHGHTKIELQDVETGEKKIVEDDNMVTNGLAKMLVPANGWANVFMGIPFYKPDDVRALSMADTLLGGIFCFEQQQQENTDNFIRNPNNKIIAKGSNYAYSGKDNVQGSYNLDESGLQEDGSYKKVWDFSTNQGNGTIASVSLTTCYGGELGDGCIVDMEESHWSVNILERLMANKKDDSDLGFAALYAPNVFENHSMSENHYSELLCYADYVNNVMFFVKDPCNIRYDSSNVTKYFYVTKKIVLEKLHVPFSKISVFSDPLNIKPDKDVIEIAIPDSILTQCGKSSNFVSMQFDSGYIYIIMCVSGMYINPGANLKILRINVLDFSSEVISILNTSPVPIYVLGLYFGYPNSGDRIGYKAGSFDINNKYFTFVSRGNGSNGKIYRISLDDNTDVVECKNADGSEFTFDTFSSILLRIDDMLYFGLTGGVLNLITCKAKKTRCYNGTEIRYFSYPYNFPFEAVGGKTPVYYEMITEQNYNKKYAMFAPVFKQDTLMTINNLPEPVTKTASQTMKITYTLEET